MRRYKSRRTYIWDSKLAYVVGLITSDGCLLNDGRHIDFTSKDRQLVELYADIIRPGCFIGTKLSGMGLPYYRVQLGDVAFYDFLLEVGLTTCKSKTLGELRIPEEFFVDFLRGVFDGDGSISGYMDVRWKNSFMFYTSFASASPLFLTWLQTTINKYLPATTGSMRKSGDSLYQLHYAKSQSRTLFDFMYYEATVPRLERKYQRYLEIFALDPYPNASKYRPRASGEMVNTQP